MAVRAPWQLLVVGAATLYAFFLPLDLVLRFPASHPLALIRWLAPLVFLTDLVTTGLAYSRAETRRPSDLPASPDRMRDIVAADTLAALSILGALGFPFAGLLGLAKLVKVGTYMSLWRRQHLRHTSQLLLVYSLY